MISIKTRRLFTRSYSTSECATNLKKTALHSFHLKNGGKLVPFAGWLMPVQYSSLGVLASHLWTRQNASLFDVSHMLQTRWEGKDHVKFLESLVVGDIQELPLGASTLSVFTNEAGGIIDDTVVNKQDEKGLYVVSNAGCAEKDWKHIQTQLQLFKSKGGDVDVKILDHLSLVALQGPKSVEVIDKLSGENLSSFGFMQGKYMQLKGIKVYISRCGYTGEDGFEISVPHNQVVQLCELLTQHPDVQLAGLGARDSLRLEAGLCLYGHDLDETITPVEGSLTWTIGKRRRIEGNFIGSSKIIGQINKEVPIERRRIGLIVQGAPARENAEIYDLEENLVGKITSGCPSPVLKQNIAMGYVKDGLHKQKTDLLVKIRGKMQKAVVVKMPFVSHNYYRGDKI